MNNKSDVGQINIKSANSAKSILLKYRRKFSEKSAKSLVTTLLCVLSVISIIGQETKPAPQNPPLPSPWGLQREAARQGNFLPRYLDLLRLENEYRASENQADSYFQARALTASYLGDVREAALYIDESRGAWRGGVVSKPLERSPLENFTPTDAEAFLLKAADRNQVLMINDGHHQPQTRVLVTRLLRGLYDKGFRYLALETLADSADASVLAKRKYLTAEDGTMTNEPVFGDLARQALEIGFTLVPYEFEGEPRVGETTIERINRRETEQARNLKQRVFDLNPNAKLLIYAGQSHISEKPIPMPGEKEPWTMMATRFKEMTGIDPLTIDQQTMIGHSRPEAEPSIYRDAVNRGWIKNNAVVFADAGGKVWTRPTEAMNVDVQVFLPPVSFDRQRPNWLARDLNRLPYKIPKNLLGGNGIRLAQAFFDNEPDAAVPVDQILIRPGQPVPVLMLPRRNGGRFRLRVLDKTGQTIILKKAKL